MFNIHNATAHYTTLIHPNTHHMYYTNIPDYRVLYICTSDITVPSHCYVDDAAIQGTAPVARFNVNVFLQ